MIPEYQQRVIDERNSLVEKVEKLRQFIDGVIWGKIHIDEQQRLLKQYTYMSQYLIILEDRIANF